jgi:methyl-accepting chemotaxis protein
MNIKQKLTWAFAVIAGLPIVLVATLVVVNLRGEARDDSSTTAAGKSARSATP